MILTEFDLQRLVTDYRDDDTYEELIDAAEGLVQAHYGDASRNEEAKALERLLRAWVYVSGGSERRKADRSRV